ncbi:MAG TPA: alpha/beta fold hydrolase [Polyangiaceae bacterium]
MRAKRGGLIGEGNPAAIVRAGNSPAVLALHGFTGTPLEVELVVEVAEELGLAASAPLLPGHGTHARDLASRTFRDWIAHAEEAFDALSRQHERVIVAGLSMGALLAVHLAATRPERVTALVMMANACWLRAPFPSWALLAVAALKLPDFAFPKVASDIGDAAARAKNLTYSAQPVHAAIEVLKGGQLMRRELGRVRCPTLILHGARDRVCPVANAHRVAKLLGSDDKRVVVFPRSHHILTRDADHPQVRAEMLRFLRGSRRRANE